MKTPSNYWPSFKVYPMDVKPHIRKINGKWMLTQKGAVTSVFFDSIRQMYNHARSGLM